MSNKLILEAFNKLVAEENKSIDIHGYLMAGVEKHSKLAGKHQQAGNKEHENYHRQISNLCSHYATKVMNGEDHEKCKTEFNEKLKNINNHKPKNLNEEQSDFENQREKYRVEQIKKHNIAFHKKWEDKFNNDYLKHADNTEHEKYGKNFLLKMVNAHKNARLAFQEGKKDSKDIDKEFHEITVQANKEREEYLKKNNLLKFAYYKGVNADGYTESGWLGTHTQQYADMEAGKGKWRDFKDLKGTDPMTPEEIQIMRNNRNKNK